MPYRFTVAAETWSSEDYTLAEMVQIERQTRVQWLHMHPDSEADHALAYIVVWWARGSTAEEALLRAGKLTAREFRIVESEDDRPTDYANGIPTLDPKERAAVMETI